MLYYIIFVSVIPAKNKHDKRVKYVPIIYAFLENFSKLLFQEKPNLVFSLRTMPGGSGINENLLLLLLLQYEQHSNQF